MKNNTVDLKNSNAYSEIIELKNENQEENNLYRVKNKKTVLREDLTIKQDYDSLSMEELITSLHLLVETYPVNLIRDQVNSIKKSFKKLLFKSIEKKKKAFVEQGGLDVDFKYYPNVKIKFDNLIQDYKSKRDAHYLSIEKKYKENLIKRLKIIENLKNLVENADSKTMYNEFKQIQDSWRSAGPVHSNKNDDIWKTYQYHVERFYDLLQLNNDFRELDFRRNLEEKQNLIQRAENLYQEKDVKKAFKELQLLHKIWKEDIGPVAKDYREKTWNKFSEATKKIHDKRHEYLKKNKHEQQMHIKEKHEIIEKIKQLDVCSNQTYKKWQLSIDQFEKLREEFFKSSSIQKNISDELWSVFKDLTKNFNHKKNNFYKNIKKEQRENLNKKLELIERAKQLKDSENWDSTLEEMKQIQLDWKKIGHVPKKNSDSVWKEFKEVCNFYFNRYHASKDDKNKEGLLIYNKKIDFLDKLKHNLSKKGIDYNVGQIKEYITTWRKIGNLPQNKRYIETKFNNIIDKFFVKLDVDIQESEMIKFRNVIQFYLEQNNTDRINSERLFVCKKIDEIIKQVYQLENNISFISNANQDNPLVANVHNNIRKLNQSLSIWKKKLTYLNSLKGTLV